MTVLPLSPERAKAVAKKVSTDRPHFIYRCYDADSVLLYIGCAVNVAKRMSSHKATKKHKAGRWLQVSMASHDVTGPYADKATANEAEADAIHTEGPVFNTQHMPGSGFTRGHRRIAAYLIDHGHRALAEETCCDCWPEYRIVGEASRWCGPHRHLALPDGESRVSTIEDWTELPDRATAQLRHVEAMRALDRAQAGGAA